MSALRTVDTARGSHERAIEIAEKAAIFIEHGAPDAGDFARANGIYDASERRHALYVIRRAAKLAEQHVAGGLQFDLVCACLDELRRKNARDAAGA